MVSKVSPTRVFFLFLGGSFLVSFTGAYSNYLILDCLEFFICMHSLHNLIQSHDFKYHAYKMTFKFISIIPYCPLESRLVCSTTNPLSPRGYLIGNGNMRIHCQTLRLPHKTHSSLLVNASSVLLIDGTQNFRDVIGFSH